MKIRILAIGKPRDDFRLYISEFSKRISRFATFDYSIIKASKQIGDKGLSEEADNIIKQIDDKSDLIVMAREGECISSVEFAKMISQKMQSSRDIVFVIGSADGTAEILRKKSDRNVSLSQMTMQHDIALIMLIEQIYRALTIINKHPYHRQRS